MKVLHVGCGDNYLPGWLSVDGKYPIEETRLDIDPECKPDVVAPMTDLSAFADGTFDVIYTSHALEHLYPHEVNTALREFLRVLTKNGHAFVIVPDLEDLKFTDEVLYEWDGHPVTAIDMVYGARDLVQFSPYMAHHCGFTAPLLAGALEAAGFARANAHRSAGWNVMGVGVKE